MNHQEQFQELQRILAPVCENFKVANIIPQQKVGYVFEQMLRELRREVYAAKVELHTMMHQHKPKSVESQYFGREYWNVAIGESVVSYAYTDGSLTIELAGENTQDAVCDFLKWIDAIAKPVLFAHTWLMEAHDAMSTITDERPARTLGDRAPSITHPMRAVQVLAEVEQTHATAALELLRKGIHLNTSVEDVKEAIYAAYV